MPRRDLNRTHFAEQRPEWTARKHALLGRFMVPAAMKMSKINRRVALIDGFAGPNSYGGAVQGSTVIMLAAARQVISSGATASVFACEPNRARFSELNANLRDARDEGILVTLNRAHYACIDEIKATIGSAAALVFLDPQTASELTLEGDIYPWCIRPFTDVIGVFMGGDACRVCSSAVAAGRVSDKMVASLGQHWGSVIGEEEAYRVFFDALKGRKKFGGLYRLRKQEPRRNAYGIFGLSDSAHGLWLLSDAVAKDWGVLRESDAQRREEHLFMEEDAEIEDATAMQTLLDVCRPVIARFGHMTGSRLGIKVFECKRGVPCTFGKYAGSDFTRAARAIALENGTTGARRSA